jgi:hypothetical protein
VAGTGAGLYEEWVWPVRKGWVVPVVRNARQDFGQVPVPQVLIGHPVKE